MASATPETSAGRGAPVAPAVYGPHEARARMSVMLVVAALAVPVSALAGIMQLELSDSPLVLPESAYWIALALVAVLCVPSPPRVVVPQCESLDDVATD